MPSSGLSSKEAPKLWKSVLGRLEIELNKPTYKTFLQETVKRLEIGEHYQFAEM